MKRLFKYLFLFWFGGTTYVTFEVLFRERSHWSMLLLAGIVFIVVGLLNEKWSWETDLTIQVITGTAIATILEFITGCIVNLWLGWDVWDYSELPFNLFGQVCPQFVLIWIPIILLAIVMDDIIRWRFFDEDAPSYWIGNKLIQFN